jgi:hypothetical protein
MCHDCSNYTNIFTNLCICWCNYYNHIRECTERQTLKKICVKNANTDEYIYGYRHAYVTCNWDHIQLNRSINSRVSVNWTFLVGMSEWNNWEGFVACLAQYHISHKHLPWRPPTLNNSSLMRASNWHKRSNLYYPACPQLQAAIHWHLTDTTSYKFVLQQWKVICLTSSNQTVVRKMYGVQAELYVCH